MALYFKIYLTLFDYMLNLKSHIIKNKEILENYLINYFSKVDIDAKIDIYIKFRIYILLYKYK